MRALITGAGSGIGEALVARMAAAGDEVIAVGRRAEPLLALAKAHGDRVSAFPLDVADEAAVTAKLSDGPAVDALILNAGICRTANVDDPESAAIWREVMAINLDGPFHVIRAVLPRMASGGRIVAVSSGLGKLGRDGKAAYAASKHGLLGLVKCLAHELAPRGITVNAVCPGWVDTPMAERDLVETGDPVAARAAAEAAIPIGRFVQPGEVAALIAWLCSKEAAAVTGQAYNISGGEFFA
ncbi:MAG: SDR family oxidoreductase [Myxococcales bacterium]|nr:SDR family oxidoreductase [Myxococcales bacterium]